MTTIKQLTLREEAFEIVNKFVDRIEDVGTDKDNDFRTAVQCALIHVNGILDNLIKLRRLIPTVPIDNLKDFMRNEMHWQKVKEEIKKL